MNQIVIGDDHVMNFTLNSDGAALDLDDASEIEVKLYQKKEVILASYKLTENTVEIVDASAGTCKVNVDRASLIKVSQGVLLCQISVGIANVDFEDGLKVSTLTDIILGELVFRV
jgi:3-dehydroquinate synthase class II